MRVALLFLSILVNFNSAAFADPAAVLPIPDIKQAVADLRKMTQDDRYKAIVKQSSAAKKSTDPTELKNYEEYAQAVKSLVEELKDETWKQNATKQMISICHVRLATYSALNSAELLKYYVLLTDYNDRKNVIEHWTSKAKSLEDVAQLSELARYFSLARKQSLDLEDEETLINVLELNEQSIYTKILRLRPQYDGVYMVDAADELPFNRVIIMDLLDPAQLELNKEVNVRHYVVAFAKVKQKGDKTENMSLYRYANVEVSNGGKTVKSITSDTASKTAASMKLEFGADFSTIKGSSTSTQGEVTFTAKRAAADSVAYYFDLQAERIKKEKNRKPIDASSFSGLFSGTYGKLNVQLNLRVFEKIDSLEDQYVGATLTFKGDRPASDWSLEFQNGRIYPGTGMIVLVSTNQNVTLKIVLAINKDPKTGQMKLEGLAYTTSGAVFKMDLAD